jgi:hypothetical protein
VNHSIGANPQARRPRGPRKVEAGALNPYGASAVGQELWSPAERDERRASAVVTSPSRLASVVLRRGNPHSGSSLTAFRKS